MTMLSEGAGSPEARPCPTLSLILMARETTSYRLQRTLASLRAQSGVTVELLVVDCNQPGDAWSVTLQEDMRSQTGVRLLTPPPDSTLGSMCNLALKKCTGEYVGFIDSSDQWQADKAARQIAQIETSPDALACCCSGYTSIARGNGVARRLIFRNPAEDPRDWFITDQFALASQLLYRREALLEVGGFDEHMEALLHSEACYRMSGKGRIVFLQDPLFLSAVPTVFRSADTLYQTMKYLLYRHDDLFLRSKKRYQAYCFRLARQAARCRLWIQMVLHWVVGLFKAPFALCHRLLRRAADAVKRHAVRAVQSLRLHARTRRLHGDIRAMRKTTPPEAPLPLPELLPEETPFQVDPLLHDHPLQFAGKGGLRHVVLPAHMTVIRQGMFAFCRDLQSIEIPETVERIEAHAFHGCKYLRRVVFQPGSQLTFIGDHAFAGCASLQELTLSGMVSQVGHYAFAGCTRLDALRFTVRSHGEQTTRALFPASWTSVPRGVFAGCGALTSVQFPDDAQLARVEDEAFAGCGRLSFVCITGQVRQIGCHAFAGCTALSTFTMPHIDAVRVIGRGAFRRCESLTFFRLPLELLNVSRQCFEGCKALKYVKVPKKVNFIESRAFADCTDLTQAIIASTATKYAKDAFPAQVQIDRGT